jgi:hypothetical protein
MSNRYVVLAVLAAACSSSALADKAYIDSGAYADLAPYTDLSPYSSVTGTWKGTLSRAEVNAALRAALAAATVPVGDAIDYPLASRKTAGTNSAAEAAPDVKVMGAAPGNGLSIDGYRFTGGEAGYVYVGRPTPR